MSPLVGQPQTWLAEWFCLLRNWIGPASQKRPASALYCLFSPCDEHRSSQPLSNLEKSHLQKDIKFTSQFPFLFRSFKPKISYFNFLLSLWQMKLFLNRILKKKNVITIICHMQYYLRCYFGCEPCLIFINWCCLIGFFQFYVNMLKQLV